MKTLLVVEAGFQSYKEHILRGIAEVPGVKLVLATGLRNIIDPSWAAPYVETIVDFSYGADDLPAVVDAYRARTGRAIDGVVTYIEPSVHFANRLAHHLGTPVISGLKDKSIRSKGLVRKRLAERGVSQGYWRMVTSADDIATLSLDAFPLIVKPVEMMSSLGVTRVENNDELRAAVERARDADFWDERLRSLYGDISTDVICEAYVEGPEYSVESAVQGGSLLPLGITKKWTAGRGFFDETAHCFPASDIAPEVKARIEHMSAEIHAALDIQNAVTHLEIRIQDGVPHLIEINCRLGGDYISELMERATGRGIGSVLAAVALGDSIGKMPSPTESHSVAFVTTTREGRIVSTGSEAPGEADFHPHAGVGDVLYRGGLVGTSRLGAVFSKGLPAETSPFERGFDIQAPVAIETLPVEHDRLLVFRTSEKDAPAFHAIEEGSWDESQRADAGTLLKRLRHHGRHHFLGYSLKQRRYVGFISAVPIPKGKNGGGNPWEHYARLAEKPFEGEGAAEVLYIVSISVLPDAPRGTGTALVRASADTAAREGIRFLRYGIRVPGYAREAARGMSFGAYYEGLMNGSLHEDLARLARRAGGKLKCPLPEYFDDPPSMNYGILVEHEGAVS